jgi:hypothetical protein
MICHICSNNKINNEVNGGQVLIAGVPHPCKTCVYRNAIETNMPNAPVLKSNFVPTNKARNIQRVYIAGKLSAMAVDYIVNMHKMAEEAEFVRRLGFAVYVPFMDILMGFKFGYNNYSDYFDNSQPFLKNAKLFMYVRDGSPHLERKEK